MPSFKLKWGRQLMAMTVSSIAIYAAVPAQAANLVYAESYLDYSLPESVSEECHGRVDYSCPQIMVIYADSSQRWINDLINTRINQFVPGAPSEESLTQSSEQKPSKPVRLSEADIKKRLDGFAQSQIDDIPEGSSLFYSFDIEPLYLGHVGDVELFEINSDIYLGGAHGLPASEYMMFDTSTKQRLTLDDLLLKGKKPAFEALMYQEYKTWVRQNESDLKQYETMWPFSLTDNATLTEQGVMLRYQPYEIAAYAYGMPEFTVPYSKLKGIVKPQYLAR